MTGSERMDAEKSAEELVDAGLLALRAAAAPPPGLEDRVLAGLTARVRAQERPLRAGWFRLQSWAPVAVAGSVVCVLAGGLVVERETLKVAPATQSAVVLREVAPPQLQARAAIATASAERVAAGRIAAGHRRGRAGRHAAAAAANK